MTITPQERAEWARHPVTKEFLAGLEQSRLDALETWAQEGYVKETGELTLQANAKALGGIAVLNQIQDVVEGYIDEGELA